MSKYGLNIRVQKPQQKKEAAKPPLPIALGFGDDDEDDNDINKEIARQAITKKSLKDTQEQHKKALEEDPSVFDYDGVYDQMKVEQIRPLAIDRQEKKSKYIETLMAKAKERERQSEVVYERRLAKERSQEDHLFADKDKFVTAAYKKKLAEQEKWLEEERLRELRELRDDVTKKKDISDFYFNLTKNVAFGAKVADSSMQAKQEEEANTSTSEKQVLPTTNLPSKVHSEEVGASTNISSESDKVREVSDVNSELILSLKENSVAEQPLVDKQKLEAHKRSEDAVAAAKERFLARKRAKEN